MALARLESDLALLAGVSSASVAGTDQPSEIHIVSDGTRAAKQIVRDVQSLAAARHRLTIDHRIVSVVELDGRTIAPPGARPVVEWVVTSVQRAQGQIEVGLVLNGVEIAGKAPLTHDSREERARAAASAAMDALRPLFARRSIGIELGALSIQMVGDVESIAVKVSLTDRSGASSTMLGVAAVRDDVIACAIKATLHALNRKVSQLEPIGSGAGTHTGSSNGEGQIDLTG